MIKILDSKTEVVAEQIYGLFQRSYQEEAQLIGVEFFPPLHRTKEQIQAASTAFLGSWLESDLAAVVEFSYEATHLNIDSLVVEPQYFRRGLATQLLTKLLGMLDWQTAEVETASANQPAIALYRRLGFTELRKWRTRDGIEKIQLTIANTP